MHECLKALPPLLGSEFVFCKSISLRRLAVPRKRQQLLRCNAALDVRLDAYRRQHAALFPSFLALYFLTLSPGFGYCLKLVEIAGTEIITRHADAPDGIA